MSVLSHLFGCDVKTMCYIVFYGRNSHSCSIKIARFENVIIEFQLQYYFDVIILV